MGMNFVASPIAALPGALRQQDDLNWQRQVRDRQKTQWGWEDQQRKRQEAANKREDAKIKHQEFVQHVVKSAGNALTNMIDPTTGQVNDDSLTKVLSVMKGQPLTLEKTDKGLDFISTDGLNTRYHFDNYEKALRGIKGTLLSPEQSLKERLSLIDYFGKKQQMVDLSDPNNPRLIELSPMSFLEAKKSGNKIMTLPAYKFMAEVNKRKAEKKNKEIETQQKQTKATRASVQKAIEKATNILKKRLPDIKNEVAGTYTPNRQFPTAVQIASVLSKDLAPRDVSGEQIGAVTLQILTDANKYADTAVRQAKTGEGGEEYAAKLFGDKTEEQFREEKINKFINIAVERITGEPFMPKREKRIGAITDDGGVSPDIADKYKAQKKTSSIPNPGITAGGGNAIPPAGRPNLSRSADWLSKKLGGFGATVSHALPLRPPAIIPDRRNVMQ